MESVIGESGLCRGELAELSIETSDLMTDPLAVDMDAAGLPRDGGSDGDSEGGSDGGSACAASACF